MKIPWKIIFIATGIIGAAFATYIWFFNKQKISAETGVWGSFSDYLNPFVSIANIAVFIWLSIQVYEYNKIRDIESRVYQAASERPILVFSSTPLGETHGEEWQLKNIGKGAALNLRISESVSSSKISWSVPVVKCFSLASQESLSLVWLTAPNVLCATYQDIFDNYFVSICVDDESKTGELNNWRSVKIRDETFTREDFLRFLEYSTTRQRKVMPKTFTPQTTNPKG